MTRVRGLMWVGLAVGSAAVIAVVTAATAPPQERGAVDPPPHAPVEPVAPPTADVPPSAVESTPIVDYDPVPAPPANDGELPPDPLETGDETLHLRLRGDTDGLPVDMRVRLWHLGAPENAEWTSGDQMQTEVRIQNDGVRVSRLACGRYRVQCLDPRKGGVDPPEFAVSRGENEVTLAVPNRRTAHLRLLVTDSDGNPVRTATRVSRGGSTAGGWRNDPDTPSWLQRRSPKRDWPPQTSHGTGMGIGCGFGGPPGVPVAAAPDGYFDLGTHVERGRSGYEMWSDDYVADAGSVVKFHADDSIAADTTFVGVAPRIDVLVAHVTCPDGSKLDPSTATIEATSRAILCPWTPPADAWRTVPVRVKVVRDACEPLEFDWTAATAGTEHRLVATGAGK